jgi:type III pantothenate kinase
MLLAIDIGTTHTTYGVTDGGEWNLRLRRPTSTDDTEDTIASWFFTLKDRQLGDKKIESVIVSSVVPAANTAIQLFAQKWLRRTAKFLTDGEQVGLPVLYETPNTLGSDRIANALGALSKYSTPIIIIDFGTATTFDVIDENGAFLGGAIMPGLITSGQALLAKVPKLHAIEMGAPKNVIGRSTMDALRSGMFLGYAGAIDHLVEKMIEELGSYRVNVISTGGLAGQMVALCETIQTHEPDLLLDGLQEAAIKMGIFGSAPTSEAAR